MECESDIMSLFSFGSAAEEAMLEGFDPASVLTPRTVETWAREQTDLTEQRLRDEAEEQAACSNILSEIGSRQQQSNVVVSSNVVVRKADSPNGKLAQLLKMPRSSRAIRKGDFYARSSSSKGKKNITAPVPDQPTVSAPPPAVATTTTTNMEKQRRRPLSPDVIVVEGPPTTAATSSGASDHSTFKRPESPILGRPKRRRTAAKISGEPEWLGEFSPSQRETVAAAFSVRQTIVREMQESESEVKECERQMIVLRERMEAAQEKVAKCKQTLKQFSHFSYAADM